MQVVTEFCSCVHRYLVLDSEIVSQISTGILNKKTTLFMRSMLICLY